LTLTPELFLHTPGPSRFKTKEPMSSTVNYGKNGNALLAHWQEAP
jgi:hypothetical protein